MCEHTNTRQLRPKIYDYNMNPPEHLLITINMSLCLDCGDKIKEPPIIKEIITYCDKRTDVRCMGIITSDIAISNSEKCPYCKEEK
jgi:hypothetical protein